MSSSTSAYASFGQRLFAVIADAVFLTAITLPLTLAVYGTDYFTDNEHAGSFGSFAINWLLPALLTIGFWVALGATPGKLVAGIRVVDANTGDPLNVFQAVIRYVAYFLSALPLLLGYFWMLRTPRKQTWHDLLAKSVVVRRAALNNAHERQD